MDEAKLSSRSVYTEYENTVKNMVSLTPFWLLCMGKSYFCLRGNFNAFLSSDIFKIFFLRSESECQTV